MPKSGAAPSMTFDTGASGRASGAAAFHSALDRAHLSRQTFGDLGLERELLSLFDRQAAQFATRLQEAVDKSGYIGRIELVHTLKGSARAIGAFAVADEAESYEATLREGAESGDRRVALLAALTQARVAIAEALAGA